MPIDPRTLFLAITLILAILGLAQLAFYLVRRQDHWFGYWGLGDFAALVAVLLLSLHGKIPALFSIATANTLAALAWSCSWNGCRAFTGRKPRILVMVILAAVIFLIMAIPSPVSNHLFSRILIISGVIGSLAVACGLSTLDAAMHEGLSSAWLATACAGAVAMMNILRGTWGALALRPAMLMSTGGLLGEILLPSLIVALVWNLCLILMVAERHRGVLLRDANCDQLTAVLNRRGFHTALLRMLRQQNSAPAGALLMIDLDYLKTVNDTLGHAAGDRLLQCFTGSASTHLRSCDAIGRLGGDEFAIALSGVGPVQTQEIVDRLRASYAAAAAEICHDFDPTLSIGMTMIQRHEPSVDQMMARADQAMYAAKSTTHRYADCPARTLSVKSV
jgi:diguanylate cyclase (GGDEF)-like protein